MECLICVVVVSDGKAKWFRPFMSGEFRFGDGFRPGDADYSVYHSTIKCINFFYEVSVKGTDSSLYAAMVSSAE